MLSVGSLFAGIGGFDLGLERAGMRTAWQVELDPFCRSVLERHFPAAERFADVREVGAHNLAWVDVICGGFPCQDISSAGAKAGIGGERSGLWSEYARVVGELRPRYVVVENVADLLARGLGTVLADLAALGYDAEWDCIPASAVGAPHRRDRLWLVAYADGEGEPHGAVDAQAPGNAAPAGRGDMADSDAGGRARGAWEQRARRWREPADGGWWATEPDVGRVAHGVPARVDRITALGNALVPQIAEQIGRRILEWEAAAMKCAWCNAEAVSRIEVQPAQYRTISQLDPQSGERISAKELVQQAIQADVCEAHSEIKADQPGQFDTRRRKAKDVEQTTIFDVLGQDKRHALDDVA